MASPASRTRRAAGLGGALVTGAFIVTQARVNGELGAEIGDGLVAALVSFGSGLVLLVVLSATLPAGRRGLRRAVDAGRSGRLAPWHYLGGLGGALLVASQGLTTAVLGTALFTVAVVAGQSSGGLAVDRIGIGPAGPQALTPPRVAGAVLMLGAVVLSVSPRLDGSAPIALGLLPLAAGLAIAVQQAVNGLVAAAASGERGGGNSAGNDTDGGGNDAGDGGGADSVIAAVLPAATINFAVGTLALAVVTALELGVRGLPGDLPAAPWLYLGGPFGAVFIGLSAWVVRVVGVLLLSLGAVAGQVVMAVVLDTVAPAAAGRPGVATVLGALLTLVAAGVAILPVRGRPWRRDSDRAPAELP